MIYEKSIVTHRPIEQFKPEHQVQPPVFRIKSTP